VSAKRELKEELDLELNLTMLDKIYQEIEYK